LDIDGMDLRASLYILELAHVYFYVHTVHIE